MSDKMREEFEVWARKMSMDLEYRNIPGVGQFFECPRTLLVFEVWQASRAAIEIDLPSAGPEPEEPEDAIDDSYMDEHYGRTRMRNMCVRAIEAAGLKVKL